MKPRSGLSDTRRQLDELLGDGILMEDTVVRVSPTCTTAACALTWSTSSTPPGMRSCIAS